MHAAVRRCVRDSLDGSTSVVVNLGIVDLDSHVADGEPGLWTEFLASGDQELAPRLVRDSDGTERLLVTDRLFPKPIGPGRGSPLGTGATRAAVSIDERVSY